MGFYATDLLPEVATRPRLRRQAKTTPLKKSRLEFFSTSHSRARFSMMQPVEPHQEKRSTPTIIVSGISLWLSRDPVGEAGGRNLYIFCMNSPVYQFDPIGLTPYDWIPLIGTWLASRDKPAGSSSSDYSYTLPTPCCPIDEFMCERSVNQQAVSYIVQANTSGAIGFAIEACAAFVAVGKGIPATIVSAVLAVDALMKADIAIRNTKLITAGAAAAKAEKCKCK